MQPINIQQGEANERHIGGQSNGEKAPTQSWVAVGSSTSDCAPKIGRTKDDGILFKIKIQIQGKVYIALIDSGASRCYASPEVEMCLQQRLQRLLVLKRNTSEITTTA